MGCVSSNLLNHDDEFAQLGSAALSHHIVSLTSSTYGLLTLDPPANRAATEAPTTPPTPSLRFDPVVGPLRPSPSPFPECKSLWSEPRPIRPGPEVINSWELMAGLDAESLRFFTDKENSDPNHHRISKPKSLSKRFETADDSAPAPAEPRKRDDDRVVIYTTSLRGVRKTFEDCNAAKAAIESLGVSICERDVSMDRGFREELKGLMAKGKIGKELKGFSLPQVFVKGKHVGGAEEILRFAEEGLLGELLQGVPKKKGGGTVCEGCGGVRFLPCFECNGSCKVVISKTLVVRCSDCNENGLVLCPICS